MTDSQASRCAPSSKVGVHPPRQAGALEDDRLLGQPAGAGTLGNREARTHLRRPCRCLVDALAGLRCDDGVGAGGKVRRYADLVAACEPPCRVDQYRFVRCIDLARQSRLHATLLVEVVQRGAAIHPLLEPQPDLALRALQARLVWAGPGGANQFQRSRLVAAVSGCAQRFPVRHVACRRCAGLQHRAAGDCGRSAVSSLVPILDTWRNMLKPLQMLYFSPLEGDLHQIGTSQKA